MKYFGEGFKNIINKIPFVRIIARRIYVALLKKYFPGSEKYWVERYRKGGNSGAGSYNRLAEFKAEFLNNFVKEKNIKSVIEFGCGDGNQLRLAIYPQYVGFDISPIALSICRDIFQNDSTKSFKLMSDYNNELSELTLSLDVIYHLVEDEVFRSYMRRLFESSSRFVIIYSSNTDEQDEIQVPHVKHREFTRWLKENIQGWKLMSSVPNIYPYTGDIKEGSLADFYIYEKV
jgi:SAM-dependent methyltransferase